MLKSDNIYPAAAAIAAVIRGGPVSFDSMSIDEEMGFVLIAAALKKMARGG